MPYMTMDLGKVRENYEILSGEFGRRGISWAIVTKLLCGNRDYLQAVLSLGVRQVCDSRVLNLKAIKGLDPSVETVFIKPPAKKTIPNVVRYADISLNTQISTVRLLSEEASRQGRCHKVIVMLELGERREGVHLEELEPFVSALMPLPNIELVGIGTNLSCLYGVLPSREKLLKLITARRDLERELGISIPLVSGGTSVTIPLMRAGALPEGVNHFRVGDSLFLGSDVYNGSFLPNLRTDAFLLFTQIIELSEKSPVPEGNLAKNLEGKEFSFDHDLKDTRTTRAIVDAGVLDLEAAHVKPLLGDISIAGVTSDMCVLDLGNNTHGLKVGDYVAFSMDYMGALRALSSLYVEKRLVNA